MWWWLIVEGVGSLLFGVGESAAWKRRCFRKKHGIDAHDAVLGVGLHNHLNARYAVTPGWSWEVSLRSADRDARRFLVRYDDAGGRAGLIEVSLLPDLTPAYREIEEPSSRQKSDKNFIS